MKKSKFILCIYFIILILFLSIIITYIKNGIDMHKLNDMYNDITILKDRVDLYYARYGKIPVLDSKYENVPSSISEINVNDNEVYYVII